MLSGTPYPIKGAWIQSTNTFVCGAAEANRTYDAFKKLEFIVVVDLFMTPTAMAFADIVLPAATYPEKDGLTIPGGRSFIGTINKAIEPVGECKSDTEIILEMGKRLNPEAWPWKDDREMMSSMLQRIGMTFEELRDKGYFYDPFEYKKYEKGLLHPDKKAGFNTPTRKVELYSTVMEKWGYDPLPSYREAPESPISKPEMIKEYPFILITGARSPAFFTSEHRMIDWLRELVPDPIVEIHPDVAAKLGINDGQWVFIETPRGRIKQRAKLTTGVDPRVVAAQYGWWFPEIKDAGHGWQESNVNMLTDNDPAGYDVAMGADNLRVLMCKIYPAT